MYGKTLSIFVMTLCSLWAMAQETVGLIHSDPLSTEGYVMITPQRNKKVYLLNNCGQLINEWTFSEEPGLSCYLLEDGDLLRAGKDSLELRDWNNNLLWSFDLAAAGLSQHHDIEPLPNGNILMIMGTNSPASSMFAHGLDTNFIHSNFKMDRIVEIEPVGAHQANVVWEWQFLDHLIQDFDSTVANYGVVSDHPELLDINYPALTGWDFNHTNSIDYNAQLDQILISVRHENELYIIDHSTTTWEAAGHSGGQSGKGGDFLWRWGNPVVYGAGSTSDRKLGAQHDAKWIEDGTYAGSISVFNNFYDTIPVLQSGVHIITPEYDTSGYLMIGGQFAPLNYAWTWSGEVLGDTMHQTKQCGVQVLPNDHILVTESLLGRFSEIGTSGDVLWSYVNPHGIYLYDQYDTSYNHQFFRGVWYPPTYAGFSGQSLTPIGLIENQNPLSASCAAVSVEDHLVEEITLYPNPTNGIVKIQSSAKWLQVNVMDLSGAMVTTIVLNGELIDLSHLNGGTYILEFLNNERALRRPVVIID